jgi:hypothetical protein
MCAPARIPPPPPCPLAPVESVQVRDVDSSLDMTLADGRVIVIAGIETPRVTRADPDRVERLRTRLLDMTRTGTIGLASLGPRDRWGRIPAAVFIDQTGPDTSVPRFDLAHRLLADGDVRYRPDPASRGCRDRLLDAEDEARGGMRGVWRDPDLRIVNIGDAAPSSFPDGFVVVEGTVTRVGETATRIYVNLERGRGGFALSASKRDIGLMQSEVFPMVRVSGARVRVRGVVDRRFGPRIDVGDADALELVTPAPAQAEH